jgi:ABC-2 type transport system ATP-binding protein
MAAIIVKDLERTYTGHKRQHGFKAAVKSLFVRERVFTYALKRISFEIKEGEMVGFVGPNGAGKSTTIKILTGILFPTKGEVDVLGFIPWKERRKYVEHIGVVFGQKSQLWWDLPPVDAFQLMKGIYKIPEKEFNHRLKHMTRILRVEEVINRPTRDLSLGERMKCEFIMALLHNPKILFLDEPTIGVDALAKEEIREFLHQINKEYKTTIILTTHDMDDIEEVCERIIIIDSGSIIYDGALAQVKKKYTKFKTIDVEYTSVKNKAKFDAILKKGKVLASRKWFKSVQMPVADAPRVVKELMQAAEVTDLLVHEPELEAIIREIYRSKG